MQEHQGRHGHQRQQVVVAVVVVVAPAVDAVLCLFAPSSSGVAQRAAETVMRHGDHGHQIQHQHQHQGPAPLA